jgi:hypothetical protein
MSNEKPEVEIIRRPNKLREKVGGSSDGKPGQIDPNAIARAMTHVSRLSEAHIAQTRIDMTDLQAAYKQLMLEPDGRAQHLRRVIKITDGIMTLGKTFGYDLLSDFANSLNHFLVPLSNPSVAQLQVVGLHIDAMHVLVRDDIKGDGGAIGQALSASLTMARDKLGAKKP